MSYDVCLKNAVTDKILESKNTIQEGGTQIIGGSTAMELNVTYNYSVIYRLLDISIKDLHGEKAKDTLNVIQRVVNTCGTKKYEKDYWVPTPGNAGYAFSILLGWAKEQPEGIWEVS